MNDIEKIGKLLELVRAMYNGKLHEYHKTHCGGKTYDSDHEMSVLARCQCALFALSEIDASPFGKAQDCSEPPCLIDDQPLTDMPEFCTRWECDGYAETKLIERNGFMVCPSCNYSWGEA